MKQLCLMLDLKSNCNLIRAYERHHEPGNVWPEVIHNIRRSGILRMRIFRSGTRLAMLLEVEDSFDPAAAAVNDALNPKVAEWERLMETYQDTGDHGDVARKWKPASCIFDLTDHPD